MSGKEVHTTGKNIRINNSINNANSVEGSREEEVRHPFDRNQHTVTIQIDEQSYAVPQGSTLAAAITRVKGMNYRQTRFGAERGPVCNMGVCFECSVFLEGRGNVRACMLEAQEGMAVHTRPNFEELPFSETELKTCEAETDTGSACTGSGSKRFTGEPERTGDRENDTFDVAIIGAGPAGLAATEELSGHGLRVVLLDEQEEPGGQIYRHIPEAFRQYEAEKAVETSKAAWIKRIADKTDLHRIQGKVIWSIVPVNGDGEVSVSVEERKAYRIYLEDHPAIRTKRIVIATGAYDRLLPFKGWTLPGIMSAGGLQIFAKTQGYVPGEAILLAGSHPFILIVAQQILQAGGRVKGIAFAQGFPKVHELFSYGWSGLRRWKKSKELLRALQTVRRAKIPIWFNRTPIEAIGEGRVHQVRLAKVKQDGTWDTGESITVECDTAGLCYGFIASSELARQLGCQTRFDAANGGWLVDVNDSMQSGADHVWVAGELTGIGGAELSEIEGRIAGLAILKQVQPSAFQRKQTVFNTLQQERSSWQGFAEMLGKATMVQQKGALSGLEQFPETHVCRCEEVSYETIKKTLQEHPHLSSMNAIKLMTRCGMGLCQGRYCEQSLQEMMKQHLGTARSGDGLTARFPVKPITIKQMVKSMDK